MPLNSSDDRAAARSFRYLQSAGIWRYVFIGVVLAFAARLLLLQVYTVASESMSPTLETGDRVLVWKLASWSEPTRGDIVVFDGSDSFSSADNGNASIWSELLLAEPLDRRLFVKRVIAIGGDRIACCDTTGRLLLNGQPLAEPYLRQPASSIAFDVEVPQGRMFLLGDDRAHSRDSRDLLGQPGGGMVGTDRVIGRVVAIGWPPARMRSVS